MTESLNVRDQGVDERTGGGGVAEAIKRDTLVETTLDDSTNGDCCLVLASSAQKWACHELK